ncbi:hypothetical protein N9L68_04500 [bacterium]|nr:hypothetical protein [bacterium]
MAAKRFLSTTSSRRTIASTAAKIIGPELADREKFVAGSVLAPNGCISSPVQCWPGPVRGP